jgi:uncharacterized repeat protein (TIGR03917 family)
MGIVRPSSGNPWRDPGESRPLATAGQNSQGDHELTLQPGAEVKDLVGALGAVPTSSIFTEQFGDVTAVLVFRTIPGAQAEAAPNPPTDRTANPPEGTVTLGVTRTDYEDALRHSLRGVEFGDYDDMVVRWLAGLGTPMVGGVVSLIYRARRNERLSIRSQSAEGGH